MKATTPNQEIRVEKKHFALSLYIDILYTKKESGATQVSI